MGSSRCARWPRSSPSSLSCKTTNKEPDNSNLLENNLTPPTGQSLRTHTLIGEPNFGQLGKLCLLKIFQINLKEAEYFQPLANKQANFAWHNQCLRLSEKYEMCYFLFQSCQTENFGSHADIYDWVLKNPSGVAKNFPPWPGIWVKRTEKSCARAQQIQ